MTSAFANAPSVGSKRRAFERDLKPWKNASPSQLKTFRSCPRKWWWEKVAGISQPSTLAQEEGTRIHAMLEDYLLTGRQPTGPLGQVALAGVPYLPPPPVPRQCVEAGFVWRRPDWPVQMLGFIDLIEPGQGRVVDHKTTSDFRYAKGEDELRTDAQSVIYTGVGPAVLQGGPQLSMGDKTLTLVSPAQFPPAVFRHIYYRRGAKGPASMMAEVRMDTTDITEGLVNITRTMQAMAACALTDDPNRVDFNPAECGAYGGCFYASHCRTCENYYTEGQRALQKAREELNKNMASPTRWGQRFNAAKNASLEQNNAPTEKDWAHGDIQCKRRIGPAELEPAAMQLHASPELGAAILYLRAFGQATSDDFESARVLAKDAMGLILMEREPDNTVVYSLTSKGREVADLWPGSALPDSRNAPPPEGALLWSDADDEGPNDFAMRVLGEALPDEPTVLFSNGDVTWYSIAKGCIMVARGDSVLGIVTPAGALGKGIEEALASSPKVEETAGQPFTLPDEVSHEVVVESPINPPEGPKPDEVNEPATVFEEPAKTFDGRTLDGLSKADLQAEVEALKAFCEAKGYPPPVVASAKKSGLSAAIVACMEKLDREEFLGFIPGEVHAEDKAQLDKDAAEEHNHHDGCPECSTQEEPVIEALEKEHYISVPEAPPVLVINSALRHGVADVLDLDAVVMDYARTRARETSQGYGFNVDSRAERDVANAFGLDLAAGKVDWRGKFIVANRRTPGVTEVLAVLIPYVLDAGGVVFE